MIDAKEAAINSSVGMLEQIQKELERVERSVNVACKDGLTETQWLVLVAGEALDTVTEKLKSLGYTVTDGYSINHRKISW